MYLLCVVSFLVCFLRLVAYVYPKNRVVHIEARVGDTQREKREIRKVVNGGGVPAGHAVILSYACWLRWLFFC